MIERLARGAHRWMVGEREVYRVHYRGEATKDNDAYVSALCARLGLAPSSPEWRTEMEIDPDAFFGEQVYPDWDDEIHSQANIDPRIRNKTWKQVSMVDFGTTNPTCILLGRWNGHWLRVWYEHYAKGHVEQWHKARMAHYLSSLLGYEKPPEHIFSEFFAMSFCDPQGSGYQMNYALPPYPWPQIKKIGDRFLNEPRSSESSLASFLALNGACCGQVLYVPECPDCGTAVSMEPGLVVDSSCRNLRLQMKLMRRKRSPEGLETPEVSEKIEDHAHDAVKYGAHGLKLMTMAPAMKKPKRREADDEGRRVFRYSERKRRSALARRYSVG